jgi:hypothetical protein
VRAEASSLFLLVVLGECIHDAAETLAFGAIREHDGIDRRTTARDP